MSIKNHEHNARDIPKKLDELIGEIQKHIAGEGVPNKPPRERKKWIGFGPEGLVNVPDPDYKVAYESDYDEALRIKNDCPELGELPSYNIEAKEGLRRLLERCIEAKHKIEAEIKPAETADSTSGEAMEHITILDIANEVDGLIIEEGVLARFTGHIDKLCEMVENYGQALQPYVKKLERTEKQLSQDKKLWPAYLRQRYNEILEKKHHVPLAEMCPPPESWVKCNFDDNNFIKIPNPYSLIYRPPKPVNPLVWFELFSGNAGLQREAIEEEKLMWDYMRMAIIHDWEIQFSSRARTERPIFSAGYKGKWFERDRFCKAAWMYYRCGNERSLQEKLSQLNRALQQVKADLDEKAEKPAEERLRHIADMVRKEKISSKPAEPGQGNKAGKKKNRPTKAEMENRNRAVVMAAAELKIKYDRLPTVSEIMEKTKLLADQIYATAPYREGKIAKKSAKLTAEMTENSIAASEQFGEKSIEHSRANRLSKTEQLERDSLIDESRADDARDKKQHKRYLRNKKRIDAQE